MKVLQMSAFILALILGTKGTCYASWQLYDDFNSGQLDPQKWEIDNSSASISVEGGRVKFVHREGNPNDSSYITLILSPELVRGIKATITVTSCSGDVRARIASFIGKIGEEYVWSETALRPDRTYISTALPVLGPAPDYEYSRDMFWGRFKAPSVIQNTPYTMSMILSIEKAHIRVEGQGEVEYTFPQILSPSDDPFKGIGTRSTSGIGSCTVYVDDVYIYTQPLLSPIHLLLLGD